MQIYSLPASYGAAWLRDGWRLLKRQPLGLPAMVVLYLFMLLLPATLPYVGVALSGVLGPFATVGLMGACRDVSAGRAPMPTVFAAPFQDAARRQLLFRLGVINAAMLQIAGSVKFGFEVENFFSAFTGSLLLSAVNGILSTVFIGKDKGSD